MRTVVTRIIPFALLCLLNILMAANCNVHDQNLMVGADPLRSGPKAQRFNLSEISHKEWRIADGSIGAAETEAFYTRREAPSQGDLLIRSELTGTIFRYDLDTEDLILSTRDKWESSTDPISECVGKSLGLGDSEQPEYKAVLWKSEKGRPVQVTVNISGRHQWGDMHLSPSKKRLAVFSFDGPYQPQNLIRGSSQVVKGDRHVDFFEVLNLAGSASAEQADKSVVRPMGRSVVLKDPTESVSLYPCWTPDEQFIIAPDVSSPWLWIIEVNPD